MFEINNKWDLPGSGTKSYYILKGIKSHIKKRPKSQDPNLKNQDRRYNLAWNLELGI